jgi:hypothetical protein
MIPRKITMVVLNFTFSILLFIFSRNNPIIEFTKLQAVIYGAILMGIANAIYILKIPNIKMKELKRNDIASKIKKKKKEMQKLEENRVKKIRGTH